MKEKIMDLFNGVFVYRQLELTIEPSELVLKVKKGETEPVIQIGAQAYTEKQWKRMLESFDDTEKDIKDRIREALEEMRKKRMEGELS